MAKDFLIISTIFSLTIFFLMFFGINYVEVKRYKYIPTICQDLSATIVPRFCCHLSCGCANASDDLDLTKCELLMAESQSLSPIACSQNSTFCPKTGPDAYCDDRYRCGISYLNNTYTYGRCQMICNQCYNVELYVMYSVSQKQQNSTYVQDFSQSLDNARAFLAAHMPNSTFWCYYNSFSITEIILSRDFTPWKWIIIVFPTLALFACITALMDWALQAYIKDKAWRWSVVSIIWIGIIVPFVILIQIWQYGLVPKVTVVFTLLFAVFGSLPIVIKILITSKFSVLQTIGISFMGLLIPLVIYVPRILYVPSSSKIVLPILSIQLGLVLLAIVCIRMNVNVLVSKHIMLL